MEAEALLREPVNDISFKKPQVRTRCKQRNAKQFAAVRDVACLAADAIRKAFSTGAEQVIVEKGVEGTAVRNQVVQILIARNANRGVRLGIGVYDQNS